MTFRVELDAKQPTESRLETFDFTSFLALNETISLALVTAQVYSGQELTPTLIVSGSATVSGPIVQQLVSAGQVGTIYILTCTVTTSLGQTLTCTGYLTVRSAQP